MTVLSMAVNSETKFRRPDAAFGATEPEYRQQFLDRILDKNKANVKYVTQLGIFLLSLSWNNPSKG